MHGRSFKSWFNHSLFCISHSPEYSPPTLVMGLAMFLLSSRQTWHKHYLERACALKICLAVLQNSVAATILKHKASVLHDERYMVQSSPSPQPRANTICPTYERDHPKATRSQMTVELHDQPVDSGAMIKCLSASSFEVVCYGEESNRYKYLLPDFKQHDVPWCNIFLSQISNKSFLKKRPCSW